MLAYRLAGDCRKGEVLDQICPGHTSALFQLQADPCDGLRGGGAVGVGGRLLAECGEEDRVVVYPSWVGRDKLVKT